MTRIAITGHRSNKLWGYNYNNANYIKLMKLFKQYIFIIMLAHPIIEYFIWSSNA